ncbi:DUF357 domain-containing protein [archaeon]|nr:DUF357 domain-containing protein [archaeon]
MKDKITKGKVEKYFSISEEAFEMAKKNIGKDKVLAEDFLNMISCYISDAKHFYSKGDLINAFAALNYAHGWLDAGARSKIFLVKDSRLFTVD